MPHNAEGHGSGSSPPRHAVGCLESALDAFDWLSAARTAGLIGTCCGFLVLVSTERRATVPTVTPIIEWAKDVGLSRHSRLHQLAIVDRESFHTFSPGTFSAFEARIVSRHDRAQILFLVAR